MPTFIAARPVRRGATSARGRIGLLATAGALLLAVGGPPAAEAGHRTCTASANLLQPAPSCSISVTAAECEIGKGCGVTGGVNVYTGLSAPVSVPVPSLPLVKNTSGSVSVSGYVGPIQRPSGVLGFDEVTLREACGPSLFFCGVYTEITPRVGGIVFAYGPPTTTTVKCSAAGSTGLPTTTVTCYADW